MLKYSIIIIAWNRKDYIRAAFQSAINQDYSGAFEIIVVANFIDNELLSASIETPDRVRYIVNETEGIGAKLATGIMASKGQYILLLEDDDLFTPNKLSDIDKIIRIEKDAGIIKNLVIPIDAVGNEMNEPDKKSSLYGLLRPICRYPELRRKEWPPYYEVSPVQGNYFSLFGSFSNNSSLTLNKEMLVNHFETLMNINIASEQILLSIAVIHGKKLLVVKDVLGKYRIHFNNASNNSNPQITLNILEKNAKDFRLASRLPLPTGYRNALWTISARFEIVYLYRMHLYGRLMIKEMFRPSIMSILLRALFGRPEMRVFRLMFHSSRFLRRRKI